MPRISRFIDDAAGVDKATRHPAASTAEAASSSKAKQFRLMGRKFLLTWPQCEAYPEEVLPLIEDHFGSDLTYAVVAREKHQDGSPHLHAFVKLNTKHQVRGKSCFDHFTGTHGNYQVAKSEVSSMRYVCKDGDYEAVGVDPTVFLQAANEKSGTKLALVVQDIKAGKTLAELNEQYPTVVFMHKRKIEEYMNFLDLLKLQAAILPWPLLNPLVDMEFGHNRAIGYWLVLNIKTDRALGEKQLWLTGPTACGKTTLIVNLAKYLRIYVVPMDEDFYDMYDDTMYDLIVFEEFKSQKTIQWMNKFVDGQHCPLRKKGGQIYKKKNLPVIVCSNYLASECYHKLFTNKPEVFATLERRFKHVQVPEGEKIQVLYKK
jgi:hypothetical protein